MPGNTAVARRFLYSQSGSGSLVSICLYLRWLLFAPPVGAYADRLDRRRLIILAQGLRFLALLLFAVAAALGLANLMLLCVLAVILGTGELLFSGSVTAMLPMVVEQSQLTVANSRIFAVRTLAENFIGQAGGGLLISLAVVAAVSSTAAFYAVAAIAILLIAGQFRPQRPKRTTTIRQDSAEGLRFLVDHKVLRTLALVGRRTRHCRITTIPDSVPRRSSTKRKGVRI